MSLKDIRKARQKEKRELRKQINDAQQLLKQLSDDTTNIETYLKKKSSSRASTVNDAMNNIKSNHKKSQIKLYKNE